MKFGDRVREARIERGMTQKELSDITGISKRALVNYENNISLPKSNDTYIRLAQALDVDLEVLKDESTEFVLKATEKYGERGRQQAQKIMQDVSALYAGGELLEEDMDALMRALQDAYWEAKQMNRKYTRKTKHKE